MSRSLAREPAAESAAASPAATLPVRSCHFGPLEIDYDDRVLAPRAWTLLQSEWAAEAADGIADGPILELCAGAGHIGLAAAVLTDRDLVQVEVDPVAANYARRNARRAGRADRVEVRTRPMREALGPDETFGLIIADPPYLPTARVSAWPRDPVRAIDGGADGLDLVRDCLDVAARHLDPGGRLLLQVAGPAQARTVRRLLDASAHWRLAVLDMRAADPERAVLLLALS